MKKIFSLFAALTLSAGLWAEEVSYLYPVYNEGDATKGIQKWETTTVEATAVTSSTAISAVTWGTAGQTTWFVVKGEDVQLSKGAICAGDVRLILADNAKLTAKATTQNAGIQVSNGNSLTIYAQSTGTQMGQLIAEYSGMIAQAAGIGGGYNGSGSNIIINGGIITATGGKQGAAGIGGGYNGSGSNIIINGGIITATGGKAGAAGIGGGWGGSCSNITINGGVVTATGGNNGGAGIGGGEGGSGSNITILAGTVTATGGSNAAGIGGGEGGSGSNITILAGTVTATGGSSAAGIGNGKGAQTDASNIFVATSLQVKADGNNPPTTVITNTGADLASSLAGQQYVTIALKPKGNLTAESFVVSDNNVIYNGEAKAATVEFADGIIGAGEMTVTYKQGTTVIASPISVGEYDIYVAVAEGDSYNAFEAAKISTLTIAKATPTVDLFTFTAPDDLTWDGNTKTATVTFNTQSGKLSGMGTITVKYNGSTDAPSAAGDYTVSIDVAEGDNYESATDLTKDDWKFSITPLIYTRDNLYDGKWGTICLGYAVPSLEDVTATFYKLNYYDGANSLYVTEVTELEAGKPYVFEAKAELFSVAYVPTDEAAEAQTINGLIGTLDGLTMEADAYALVNNMVVKAAAGTTVPANRAYIDLTQVSTEPLVAAGAPRRIGVASAPTGFELNNIQKKACKVLDKGQFVIIRDNKRFNAQGIEIQ